MRAAPLLAAAVLSACAPRPHRPPPQQPLRLVVGPPYLADGVIRYPRPDFEYDATGLATVIGPRTRLASDGEAFDPTALVGAHPTLQLPCVVRVTNLDNGRQLLMRLLDRGPARRGRILGVSQRAGQLLGIAASPGATPVRVQVEGGPSRQLAAGLASDAPLGLTAAPRAAVQADPLPPLPGTLVAPDAPRAVSHADAGTATAAPMPPLRLPEQVALVPVRGYALFVVEAEFGRRDDAAILARRAASLGAHIRPGAGSREGRAWRVLIGPLGSVAEADAALDRAIAAGVVGASIVAE